MHQRQANTQATLCERRTWNGEFMATSSSTLGEPGVLEPVLKGEIRDLKPDFQDLKAEIHSAQGSRSESQSVSQEGERARALVSVTLEVGRGSAPEAGAEPGVLGVMGRAGDDKGDDASSEP